MAIPTNSQSISGFPGFTTFFCLSLISCNVFAGNVDRIHEDGFESRLVIEKSCPPVAAPGAQIIYIIEYVSISSSAYSSVVLVDQLPTGVTVNDILHEWNAPYLLNNPMPADPLININEGRIEVEAGPLLPQEGGLLWIAVEVDVGFSSGEVLVNETLGSATDFQGMTQEFVTRCSTLVSNADLYLRKHADPLQQLPGSLVTFELVISNEEALAARNVQVWDYLPIDMEYVQGSAMVTTPGWSLFPGSDPWIDGSSLVWAEKTGNALMMTNGEPGVIPGHSGVIVISFMARVNDETLPDTPMENCAEVQSDTGEDSNFENFDCVTVTSIFPDR